MVERDNHSSLKIVTLGDFQVRVGDKILTQDANRAYRLWQLFKYLLTHRGQGILPEVLVDVLWPEEEYENPRCVVRSLIYRLRRLLATATGRSGSDFISFEQGGYRWNADAYYWLDAQEFELLCQQARIRRVEDPLLSIELLQKALSRYKGEYLPEAAFYDWAFPQRHYYRRLYLEGFVSLITLLQAAGRHEEIIGFCEEAIQIEPLEEEFHIPLMETLLHMGRRKQALAHYHYITAAIYQQLGVKPSTSMRHLYSSLKSREDEAREPKTMPIPGEGLETYPKEGGAFLCDPHIFQSIYELEQRRTERKGRRPVLGIVTLIERIPQGPSRIREAMEHLQGFIPSCLRKGDALSRWNENQILILLDTHPREVPRVLRRIEDNFIKTYKGEGGLQLNMRLQSPFPMDTLESLHL